MAVTEMELKKTAVELNVFLSAFEGNYFHFISATDKKMKPQELLDRESAATLFYKISDTIKDFAMKASDLAETIAVEKAKEEMPQPGIPTIVKETAEGKTVEEEKVVAEKKASAEDQNKEPVECRSELPAESKVEKPKRGRPSKKKASPLQDEEIKEEKKPEEPIPGTFNSPISESTLYGTYIVVSTRGSVRIINTVYGCLYQANGIAEICGHVCPQKWVSDNLLVSNICNITLYETIVRRLSKTGRVVGNRMRFVSEEDAEKIMVMSHCDPMVVNWVRKRVFGFRFRSDARKYKENELTKLLGKSKIVNCDESGVEMTSRDGKNTVSYKNGNLEVSWQ
ncbi:MAG: hypothetical protein LUD12_13995 [Lachnospiraceae bacterium]|nr:hypothetical protein [Lachnospiraceae bacterium]